MMIEFVFLGIIAVLLLAPFLLSLRRTREEKGLQPIYEDRAMIFEMAFTLGSLGGANIPYWRLTFYDRFMVISAGLTPRLIPYDEIIQIRIKRFLIFRPLYLEYLGYDRKHGLYIFPRSKEKILELIKQKQNPS
jgi:hypothetical protein